LSKSLVPTVHALGQTAMLGDRGQARGRTYCTCSGTDIHALGIDRHAQGKTGIQRDADGQTGIPRDKTYTSRHECTWTYINVCKGRDRHVKGQQCMQGKRNAYTWKEIHAEGDAGISQ
jgi:hypothetical protein